MLPGTGEALFSPWTPGIFSLVVFAGIIIVLVAIMVVFSSRIGEKKDTAEKLRAYESGIIPTGQARLRFPIPFYLVAIFFLIFDVEGAFIFSWAVACKTLGWTGWFQISYFIFVLIIGLVYIWKKGGLDWGPDSARK